MSLWKSRHAHKSITVTTVDGIWTANGLSDKQAVRFMSDIWSLQPSLLSKPAPANAIYISGPMSGMPEFGFPAFREAALRLRSAGFEVVDPSEKGLLEGWTWEQYLTYDLKEILERCKGLAVLDDWQKSRGASLEVYVARALGMKVQGVEQWLKEAP